MTIEKINNTYQSELKKIRVGINLYSDAFCYALKLYLQSIGFTVVFSETDMMDALEEVDVMIIDSQDVVTGVSVIKKVREKMPNTKIMLYTAPSNQAFESLCELVDSYMYREKPTILIEEILKLVSSDTEYIRNILEKIDPEFSSDLNQSAKNEDLPFGLTNIEMQIIKLIKRGKTTHREILQELCMSMGTVKAHFANIYRKTGVNNKVDLLRLFSEKLA